MRLPYSVILNKNEPYITVFGIKPYMSAQF